VQWEQKYVYAALFASSKSTGISTDAVVGEAEFCLGKAASWLILVFSFDRLIQHDPTPASHFEWTISLYHSLPFVERVFISVGEI